MLKLEQLTTRTWVPYKIGIFTMFSKQLNLLNYIEKYWLDFIIMAVPNVETGSFFFWLNTNASDKRIIAQQVNAL